MSEAALSKSLDELIAEQRAKQKPKSEPRRGGRERGPGPARGEPRRGGSGGGGGGSGGEGRRRDRPVNMSITIEGGGVGKARGGPRGGGGRGRDRDADRQTTEQRRAALEGNARWGHDRYEGGARAEGRRGRGNDPRRPTTLGTKIYISNLDWAVSEDDVKELFETCGPLVKHMIHFDNSGRSEGTAEVIYANRVDAERAMKRYNNVQLDGKPMALELIEQLVAGGGGGGAGGRVLSSGLKVTGGGGSGALTVTRSFAQATSGLVQAAARQPRGRGSVKSRVDYMQE